MVTFISDDIFLWIRSVGSHRVCDVCFSCGSGNGILLCYVSRWRSLIWVIARVVRVVVAVVVVVVVSVVMLGVSVICSSRRKVFIFPFFWG